VTNAPVIHGFPGVSIAIELEEAISMVTKTEDTVSAERSGLDEPPAAIGWPRLSHPNAAGHLDD
jgi:hypothetical protein